MSESTMDTEKKLEARLADFQNRDDAVDKYVTEMLERWRKHPETAPRPQRTRVYEDDDEMYADELGMSMRNYVRQTM